MMDSNSAAPKPVDAGLQALVALLRFNGIGADPEQIYHHMGKVPIGVSAMIRCAKAFGIKARVRDTTLEKLASAPLPAIFGLLDGRFLLIVTVSPDPAI